MNIQGKYIKYENYVALEEKCAALSERLNLISDLMEYALRVFSQEQKKKEKPYADIAMLVALLEAAEHRIAETDQRNAELTARIEPMDRRIAELEARAVVVKQFDDFQIVHYGRSEDYAKGYIDCQNNYNKAIAVAGIKVKE